MKVFIIQKYQKTDSYWFGQETYTYKQTLSKAFKSRQDAHKYLEGTIGAVRENNRWRNKTCYNSYLYEVKQVNID